MYRRKYNVEAETYLINQNFYENLTHNNTKYLIQELHTLITHLHHSIQTEINGLVPEQYKPGTFYTIPKLYKFQK